ncbi:MAG: lipoyl(octanoyl) transferase LipB, partial [Phycisphaerales bacterium]
MLPLTVIDLGHATYAEAYAAQCRHLEDVLAARDAGQPVAGFLLFVEHPPTITITPRPEAADHILHSRDALASMGIAVVETDRGGDVTYHGPGQIVAYPILDLNALGLRLHDYMRLLEHAVIQTVAEFGISAGRDHCATGVWVGTGLDHPAGPSATVAQPRCADPHASEKICAMGVR